MSTDFEPTDEWRRGAFGDRVVGGNGNPSAAKPGSGAARQARDAFDHPTDHDLVRALLEELSKVSSERADHRSPDDDPPNQVPQAADPPSRRSGDDLETIKAVLAQVRDELVVDRATLGERLVQQQVEVANHIHRLQVELAWLNKHIAEQGSQRQALYEQATDAMETTVARAHACTVEAVGARIRDELLQHTAVGAELAERLRDEVVKHMDGVREELLRILEEALQTRAADLFEAVGRIGDQLAIHQSATEALMRGMRDEVTTLAHQLEESLLSRIDERLSAERAEVVHALEAVQSDLSDVPGQLLDLRRHTSAMHEQSEQRLTAALAELGSEVDAAVARMQRQHAEHDADMAERLGRLQRGLVEVSEQSIKDRQRLQSQIAVIATASGLWFNQARDAVLARLEEISARPSCGLANLRTDQETGEHLLLRIVDGLEQLTAQVGDLRGEVAAVDEGLGRLRPLLERGQERGSRRALPAR